MAFKIYDTIADYQAEGLPLEESRVSLVRKDNQGNTIDELHYDSIGRITMQPLIGDVCCVDEQRKIKFLSGGNSLKDTLPTDWELVGFVYDRNGNYVDIVNKSYTSNKYLNLTQFMWEVVAEGDAINSSKGYDLMMDGVSHTKEMGIRCAFDWDNYLVVTFSYQVGVNDNLETVAASLQTAIEDRIQTVWGGSKTASQITAEQNLWHCYAVYKDGNNELSYTPTDGEDHDNTPLGIIIQRDQLGNVNQIYSQGLRNITYSYFDNGVWMQLSSNNTYIKNNGKTTNLRGILNTSFGNWSTNGRTPTADVPVGSEAGNTNPVNQTAFETNAYCNALKTKYVTYTNYLRGEYGIKYPQKYGAFILPNSKDMAREWPSLEAPIKGFKTNGVVDSTKFIKRFPALWNAYNITTYDDVSGLNVGCWRLMGIEDGVKLLNDDTLYAVNKSMRKLNISEIDNTSMSFVQLAYGTSQWTLTYGCLYSSGNVQINYRLRSVCTLDLTQINQSNNS